MAESEKQHSFSGMKGLAIIDTPLELLHFLNMQETTQYGEMKWDLLFLENAASDHKLFSKIKETNLFSSTYFVSDAWKNYKMKTEQGVKWYLLYLNKNNAFKIWPNLPEKFYNYDYMSFCTYAGYAVCNFAYHFNNKLKFIWLEDGMTTYVNYGDFFPGKTIKSVIKTILLHNMGKKNVECQFLYHPELASYNVPCERHKLSPLKANSRTAKMSDLLFNVSEKDFIKQRYIYFDNAFASFGMKLNDSEILQLVSNTTGNNHFIIKVHPRNDSTIYVKEGYNVSTKSGIPWEAYFFHNEAVDNKVLIGVISTALLSPFLYFDSKQKVMSLIRFLDMDSIDVKTRKYIESVRDIFMVSHPDIFILPKTKEELEYVLKEMNTGD